MQHTPRRVDVWAEVEAERRELAGLLEGLADEQWDEPTLCDAWRVRHLVAHLTRSNFSVPGVLAGVVRAGFNFNRFAARHALRHGAASPAELLERFRADIPSRKPPPSSKPSLIDVLVHQQDIRRPLRAPREIPPERLRFVADRLKGRGLPFRTRQRIAGLRLAATDTEWAHGEGAEVRGPLEALTMVMAGRGAALSDLEGEGVAILEDRL